MGKIFDALEKAERRTSGKALPTLRSSRKSSGRKQPVKVVPLNNTTNGSGKGNLDPKLVVYHDPKSVEAELFKVLRTNILFPSKGTPPKTIMVTSALPDDGKSFISANLALSLAQGVEERVLLVDADIRKPDIHSLFGFELGAGLSNYLQKGEDVGDIFVKTVLEKLILLPAGKLPSNPTELLSSKRMLRLLEEVKSRYDDRYIIIDTPPPTMAAETYAISQYVDGIILVVRAGKTPRDAVQDTIEQLGKDKIIGIVLNQADQSTKKYYGYSKSYY